MTEVRLTFIQRRVANNPRLARFLHCDGGARALLRKDLAGLIDGNSANIIRTLGRLKDSAAQNELASIVEMAKDQFSRTDWHTSHAISASLVALGQIGDKTIVPLLEAVKDGKDGYGPVAFDLSATAAQSLIMIKKPAKGSAEMEELAAYALAAPFARALLKYVANRPVNIERFAEKLQRLGKNAQPALVRACQVYFEPNVRRILLALILRCDLRTGEGIVKGLQEELGQGLGVDPARVSEMIAAAKVGRLRLG